MKGREFRNDVMHDAFMRAGFEFPNSDTVKAAVRSLRRFKPSEFGGWRVLREEKGSVKRRRKGSVS